MKAALVNVECLQGELCSPSEAAERLAALETEGHITFAHHPPFSCSAAGSSVSGFEGTQGTQFGTVVEEAAAIISYSQMHAGHSPAVRQHPDLELKSQQLHPASQARPCTLSSQRAHAQVVTVQPQTQINTSVCVAAEALQVLSDLPAVVFQCGPAVLPSGPGKQAPSGDQPDLDQILSQSAEPLSAAAAANQGAAVLQSQSDECKVRPVEVDAAYPCCTLQQPAPETEAAEVTASAAAAVVSQADSPTQCMDDELGDVAATEVQLPQALYLGLPLSPHGGAAKAHSPAPEVTTVADTVDLPAVGCDEDLADAQAPPAAEEAATPRAASDEAHVASQAPQPHLQGSPTQTLQLQLTCLESQAAQQHPMPAVASPSQHQLQLHLTSDPVSPAAQHAERGAQHNDNMQLRSVRGSPAKLTLNLDTQLPDQELRAPAGSAAPASSPQPAARVGWWGQPWSVAQQADMAGPEHAGPEPSGVMQPHCRGYACMHRRSYVQHVSVCCEHGINVQMLSKEVRSQLSCGVTSLKLDSGEVCDMVSTLRPQITKICWMCFTCSL